jgi:hypothetical protein
MSRPFPDLGPVADWPDKCVATIKNRAERFLTTMMDEALCPRCWIVDAELVKLSMWPRKGKVDLPYCDTCRMRYEPKA